jgi:hypothetical protein
MKTLQEAANELLAQKDYDERITNLLRLIANEPTENLVFKRQEYLKLANISKISDFKDQTIGIIFDYANLALQDGILTEKEMKNIALLKAFFKIKEGDFYKMGYEQEVKKVLSLQLEKMYADQKIDDNEAVMQTELQEIFGLSYDQFCEIEKSVKSK